MSVPQAARPWFGDRSAPPETGVSPERTAEILREAQDGLPVVDGSVALQPLLVPLANYRELLSAATAVLALLRRTVAELAPDSKGRMAALGVDPADCPRLTDDDAFELRHCADLARADVVIGPDGPKFIEFNVSAAFGGMVHFETHHRAWRRIAALSGMPAPIGVDPYARLAALVERLCGELDVPPSLAMIDLVGEGYPETAPRLFELQVDLLRSHGVHAESVPLDRLADDLHLPGGPRHRLGLAQYSEQDARALGVSSAPALAAQQAGVTLIPSQSHWLVHSKKVLALTSEGRPWMSEQDRRLAARYLPWSRVVGDREVGWQGRRHQLPELLVRQAERFVLKGASGWSGHEVFFGARTEPGAWADLVQQAVRTGYFVAQEVVHSQPYPLDVMEESGEVVRYTADTVISPFCVGGVGAGCFARFVEANGPGVISAMSKARLGCLLGAA
ncbi:hypothetical protein [Kitasatospora kifunensis]|uniref:Glutathionylspermidine synthase pre-ATP-grasp-like domain-containing protein n=1 Tax=Kitasatospora kifunensis TaxID=58351 RepID=A0A7W7QZK1_KITKI|nr:hypothetical protein [Kitasatospora kifunensis]MBB4922430.1 hypothetical protein [Kitasatospora kifunensis]